MKSPTIGAAGSAANATSHPDHHHVLATALHGVLQPLATASAHIHAVLAAWHARTEERRHLLAMSERDLKDLGITRTDIPNVISNRYTRET